MQTIFSAIRKLGVDSFNTLLISGAYIIKCSKFDGVSGFKAPDKALSSTHCRATWESPFSAQHGGFAHALLLLHSRLKAAYPRNPPPVNDCYECRWLLSSAPHCPPVNLTTPSSMDNDHEWGLSQCGLLQQFETHFV